MRTGVLARKIGMTRVYTPNREHNSVTVLKLPPSIVIGHRKTVVDRYNALIRGFEKVNSKGLKKPQKEFFSKIKQEPLKKVKEFRVSEENFVENTTMEDPEPVNVETMDVLEETPVEEKKPDFNKMNLGNLKAYILEQGWVEDASKMKKAQILSLIQERVA